MCIIDYNRYSISFIELSCFCRLERKQSFFSGSQNDKSINSNQKSRKNHPQLFTKNSINQGQKKSTLKKGWVERLLKNYIQYLPFEMISFQGQHWKNMCKNSTSRLVGELFFASGVVPPESQLKKLHAEFLLILRGGVAGCFFDKCPSFQYLESRSTP